MKASKTRVIKDSSITKLTGSKISLESYKQCYARYVSPETFSINVFVEQAGYEVFSVFFWMDEAMRVGVQIVLVGESDREESMKDVAGVRPNSSEQASCPKCRHWNLFPL